MAKAATLERFTVPPTEAGIARALFPQGLIIPVWLRKLKLVDRWMEAHNAVCEACATTNKSKHKLAVVCDCKW